MSQKDLPVELQDLITQRARELFESRRLNNHRRMDRIFAVLMPVQWLAGVAAATWISPRTWAGTDSQIHIHVWAAVFLGGAVTLFPVLMALFQPGRALTRHVIAIGQMLTSALLIHLTGGRIETHFHVFGSLAFVAFYRDWTVLVTATLVVAGDHWLRGMYFPQSVYGVLAASPWRSLEHAGWVAFEDIILVLSCRLGIQEMRSIAAQQAELETTNRVIEARVQQRTAELAESEATTRGYARSLEAANRELAAGKAELEAKQSEMERLNAALEEATQRAEAASKAKSTFLANMSHEIRTPMTAILGFSDLLIEADSNASERLNVVNIIRRNGQHLLALINDILDLSKIEAGRLEVERTACNPCRILTDVADLLDERAREKCISLSVELLGAVPERIESDPVRLKQAVVNLVGNAVKFTSRGGVKVQLQCDREREELTFHVVDTGSGISSNQLARLFRPFAQADVSTTRQFGGTGLGLAISKSLAQLLGGDLTAASRPGAGSTFSLTVATGRLEGVQMVTSLDGLRTPIEPPVRADKLPRIRGRVLLVEDGPDNQRLISTILRKAGAEVEIVANGREGVDAALLALHEDCAYDLILMDMQMPVMDGYAATRVLRDRGYCGQIVALTAHAMKGELERCLVAGCDHYLSKPISRELLLREVAQRLAKAAATRVAAHAGP